MRRCMASRTNSSIVRCSAAANFDASASTALGMLAWRFFSWSIALFFIISLWMVGRRSPCVNVTSAKMSPGGSIMFRARTFFLVLAITASLTAQKKIINVKDNPNRLFNDAVQVGDTLYLSGQMGRDADGKFPEGFTDEVRL